MLGPVAAFLSSVTWAIGSQAYSKFTRNYPATTVNFTRALIAFPLFVLATFISAGGLSSGLELFAQIGRPQFIWFGISMICSYGLGDACFFLSCRSLGVPGALAIASAYPVWTVIAGVLFKGSYPALFQVFGFLVALSGIIMVILFGPARDRNSSQRTSVGVLLAVGTSLFWGINTFTVGQGALGISSFAGNAVRMLFATVICSLLGWTFARGHRLMLPMNEIKGVAWIFVLESFGGSLFFMYGLSHSSVILGSTLAALAPVIAVPIALAMGSEKFSWMRTFGVILAVIGVCLISVR